MHLWSVFLVQNPQNFRGPAAPRPRLQRRLRRRPRPLTLLLAVVVTMALTMAPESLKRLLGFGANLLLGFYTLSTSLI